MARHIDPTEAAGLNARLKAAESAHRSGRHSVAYDLYSELGRQGHPESQVMAAWMTLNGLGVAQDADAAMRWFEQAAALGSPTGCF
jgi:TPR repeat protein